MNIDTTVNKKQELVQDDTSAEPFFKRGAIRRSRLRASDRKPLKRQGSRSSSPAYLKSWGKIPEDAYRYIIELLGDVHPDTRHFYFHVLLSSRSWKYEENWIPVPWEIIHRKVRKAAIEGLEAEGLLEVDRRYLHGIKSREYRIPIEIRRQFRHLCWEHRLGPKVNPFTGKRTQARDKSKLNDEYNNPFPELVRNAVSQIEWGIFNDRAISEHLAGLRAREEEAFKRLEEARESREDDPVAYERALRDHQAAFGRLDNDQRCGEHLLNQEPEHVGEGIYRYRVAYRPQMSGRVSQISGGLQSCSREMKAAAYTDVENIHNYDIKSCHPCLLAAHLDDAGFDSSWLRTYLETENAKVIYAERGGLSVDTWKTCLCALFMGAHLPKDIRRGKGTIRKELELDAGEDLEAVYEKFKSVVEPLYKVLKKWHRYLDEVWVPANQYGGRGGIYVRNDTGSILNISELKGARPDRRRSKLAAFLLQGKEAAFIHRLTLLSHVYGYQVISNEHDGLITIGEIPSEAIDIVRKDCSMQYVEIVEKAFV